MQKDVKKKAAVVTQLDLVEKAHKRILESLRIGLLTLSLFENKCKKGSIDRSEIGPIRDMIRATMAARQKVMENFFEICKSKEPLSVVIDNDTLQTEMAVRPSNPEQAMNEYRSEYRKLALGIRKTINQSR